MTAAGGQGRVRTRLCSIPEARAACAQLHRHLQAPRGGLFAVVAELEDGRAVGWCVVGRPSARALQRRNATWWRTVEVTRCATDGTANACSALYGAARREAFRRGADVVITYTLPMEGGASLRGAGFVETCRTGGGAWSRRGRARDDAARPTCRKVRWRSRWARRVVDLSVPPVEVELEGPVGMFEDLVGAGRVPGIRYMRDGYGSKI